MSHTIAEPPDTANNALPEGSISKFATYLGLELLLALVIGVFLLGRPSLWLDEALSIKYTSASWSELLDVIAETEAMHGFYYAVLKAWSGVAGTSEFAVRIPSVLFFVIAVYSLVVLAKLLFSERVALIAGLLLTVNPFLLEYARQARGYAMVTALITVATLLFVRLMLSGDVDLRLLGAYTLVGTLSVYAHAWSLFVLAVHAGVLLLVIGFRKKAGWLIGSWSVMAVGISPLLLFFVVSRGEQVSWIPEVGVVAFLAHFRRQSGGRILLTIFIGMVLVAFWRYTFGDRRDHPRWAIVMLAAWIVVPTVLTFLLSLAVPLFVSRYMIIALPALVLLVAVGMNALRPTWLGIGVLIMVVGLSTLRSNVPRYTSSKEDWRATTEYVLAEAQPYDVVVFYAPVMSVPFEYYQERFYPAISPEIIRYDSDLEGDGSADAIADALFAVIADQLDRRVWVVLSHDLGGIGPLIEDEVYELQRRESRRAFEGTIRVILIGRQ